MLNESSGSSLDRAANSASFVSSIGFPRMLPLISTIKTISFLNTYQIRLNGKKIIIKENQNTNIPIKLWSTRPTFLLLRFPGKRKTQNISLWSLSSKDGDCKSTLPNIWLEETWKASRWARTISFYRICTYHSERASHENTHASLIWSDFFIFIHILRNHLLISTQLSRIKIWWPKREKSNLYLTV